MDVIPVGGLEHGGFSMAAAAVVRIANLGAADMVGVMRYPPGELLGLQREFGIVFHTPGEVYGEYTSLDLRGGRIVSLDFGSFWVYAGSPDSDCWVLPPLEVPAWAGRVASGSAQACAPP